MSVLSIVPWGRFPQVNSAAELQLGLWGTAGQNEMTDRCIDRNLIDPFREIYFRKFRFQVEAAQVEMKHTFYRAIGRQNIHKSFSWMVLKCENFQLRIILNLTRSWWTLWLNLSCSCGRKVSQTQLADGYWNVHYTVVIDWLTEQCKVLKTSSTSTK